MPVTQLRLITTCDPKVVIPVASHPPQASSPPSLVLQRQSQLPITPEVTTHESPQSPYLRNATSSEDSTASSCHSPEASLSPRKPLPYPYPSTFASHVPVTFSSPVRVVARPVSLQRHYTDSKCSNLSYRPSGQYLRPNARFVGEQQSGKARYQIQVTFKTVDLPNLLVSGYLQINGLTEHHPEITTFFNGQIINNPLLRQLRQDRTSPHQDTVKHRHSFLTDNKEWGSSLANDLDHWRKLTGSKLMSTRDFKEHLKNIRDGKDDTQYLYMRWKEEFLVPDSRIRQIHGASFEGFYYIVLCIGSDPNSAKTSHSAVEVPQMQPGTISGLYYHQSLEKFQSLNLRYVPNHGKSESFQFC